MSSPPSSPLRTPSKPEPPMSKIPQLYPLKRNKPPFTHPEGVVPRAKDPTRSETSVVTAVFPTGFDIEGGYKFMEAHRQAAERDWEQQQSEKAKAFGCSTLKELGDDFKEVKESMVTNAAMESCSETIVSELKVGDIEEAAKISTERFESLDMKLAGIADVTKSLGDVVNSLAAIADHMGKQTAAFQPLGERLDTVTTVSAGVYLRITNLEPALGKLDALDTEVDNLTLLSKKLDTLENLVASMKVVEDKVVSMDTKVDAIPTIIEKMDVLPELVTTITTIDTKLGKLDSLSTELAKVKEKSLAHMSSKLDGLSTAVGITIDNPISPLSTKLDSISTELLDMRDKSLSPISLKLDDISTGVGNTNETLKSVDELLKLAKATSSDMSQETITKRLSLVMDKMKPLDDLTKLVETAISNTSQESVLKNFSPVMEKLKKFAESTASKTSSESVTKHFSPVMDDDGVDGDGGIGLNGEDETENDDEHDDRHESSLQDRENQESSSRHRHFLQNFEQDDDEDGYENGDRDQMNDGDEFEGSMGKMGTRHQNTLESTIQRLAHDSNGLRNPQPSGRASTSQPATQVAKRPLSPSVQVPSKRPKHASVGTMVFIGKAPYKGRGMTQDMKNCILPQFVKDAIFKLEHKAPLPRKAMLRLNDDELIICFYSRFFPDADWIEDAHQPADTEAKLAWWRKKWTDKTRPCPQCQDRKENGEDVVCFYFKDFETVIAYL
ncbi:hypothetical protein VTL71DRAFT_13169 [Oculimacula yallundae]|uniref:Uncharacterized protein n=1 Tax=Oculimacula yallundae TaxID=86028 RepID=A0ABR4CPS7_9HELO